MKKSIFENLDERSRSAIRKTAIILLAVVTAMGFFFFLLNVIDRYFEWDFYSVLIVMVVGAAALILVVKNKFVAGGSVFLFGMQLVLMAEPFMLIEVPHSLAAYLMGNILGMLVLLFFAGLFVGQIQLIISVVLIIADILVISFLSDDDEIVSASFYVVFGFLISGVFVFFINRMFLAFINRAQEESQRKELLLRELHHRVKNNLQIVSSMLNMQADKVAAQADRQLFVDSENRIASLAIVHDHLYNAEDLELVLMDSYIRDLVAEVMAAADTAGLGIEVEFSLEELTLDLQRAVLCGLIVTELLMNSIQHAFPANFSRDVKKISITLCSLPEDSIKLQISDNGIGLTEALQKQAATDGGRGIGFYIIDALVEQLNAGKNVASSEGSRYEITFPKG